MIQNPSGNALQYFISILLMALLYTSKVGLWFGIIFTTENLSKKLVLKDKKYALEKIGKGLIIIGFSFILYLIVSHQMTDF